MVWLSRDVLVRIPWSTQGSSTQSRTPGLLRHEASERSGSGEPLPHRILGGGLHVFRGGNIVGRIPFSPSSLSKEQHALKRAARGTPEVAQESPANISALDPN